MLFFLTGPIQTGKTRWLQSIIAELEERGVTCQGVVAPGVWKDHGEEAGDQRYEKLGIDNMLLPQHEIVHFAKRSDLAQADGTADGNSQSAQAKLGWAIDDAAIDQVNAHFTKLIDALPHTAESCDKVFTIIDEFGRLELERDSGLTEAMKLLSEGPKPGLENVLIVVRKDLLSQAVLKFAFWGEFQMIFPDDAGRRSVITQMGFRV